MVSFANANSQIEEVGHDHVCTKSGNVASYVTRTVQNVSHDVKP